jgi:hypothetical protein
MQPHPKMLFAFVGHGKGAVAVAFKMAKEHGVFFGAAHIFLKFPFRDCVERLFVHTGFLAQSGKTGQGRTPGGRKKKAGGVNLPLVRLP